MDTFFEQIVSVKKTAKSWLIIFGIIFAAIIVSFALLLLGMSFLRGFFMIILLLIFGVFYGAWQVIIRQSVEYEYIVTNGSMDVDRIVAQRSRKRVLSFELSAVEQVEKYNPAAPPVGNYSKTVIACSQNAEDAYYMVVSSEAKGTRLLVFAPDDRLKDAIAKSLPRFIANGAFKN